VEKASAIDCTFTGTRFDTRKRKEKGEWVRNGTRAGNLQQWRSTVVFRRAAPLTLDEKGDELALDGGNGLLFHQEVNDPSLEDVEVGIEHVGVEREVGVLVHERLAELEHLVLDIRRRHGEHELVLHQGKVVEQAGVHLDPLPLLRLRNLVDEGGGGRPVNAVHVNDVVQREVEDQVRADDQDVLLQVVNNQNKEEGGGGSVSPSYPIQSNPIL